MKIDLFRPPGEIDLKYKLTILKVHWKNKAYGCPEHASWVRRKRELRLPFGRRKARHVSREFGEAAPRGSTRTTKPCGIDVRITDDRTFDFRGSKGTIGTKGMIRFPQLFSSLSHEVPSRDFEVREIRLMARRG